MPQKNNISWTIRCEDGVKREVRVSVTSGHIKWQFKRKDEESWDYDSKPTKEDWDVLENIITRRTGRGRSVHTKEHVQKFRMKANV